MIMCESGAGHMLELSKVLVVLQHMALHPASTKAIWIEITISSCYRHWAIILLTTVKRICTGIIGSIDNH